MAGLPQLMRPVLGGSTARRPPTSVRMPWCREAYTAGLAKGTLSRPVIMPLVRGELVGQVGVSPIKGGEDALTGIAERANIAAATGAGEVVLAWESHDVATADNLPIVGPAQCLNMVAATCDAHVLHQFPYAEHLLSRSLEGDHPDPFGVTVVLMEEDGYRVHLTEADEQLSAEQRQAAADERSKLRKLRHGVKQAERETARRTKDVQIGLPGADRRWRHPADRSGLDRPGLGLPRDVSPHRHHLRHAHTDRCGSRPHASWVSSSVSQRIRRQWNRHRRANTRSTPQGWVARAGEPCSVQRRAISGFQVPEQAAVLVLVVTVVAQHHVRTRSMSVPKTECRSTVAL
ncbi:hypothetical protein [Streptomyces sp. NPDC097610]|uniref:hypothetical protein n=1 Tax=Streptomyces sp. NPDC097610 TaxID=3157227 RepID=UPI00332EF54D